jgi:hypothetical protein
MRQTSQRLNDRVFSIAFTLFGFGENSLETPKNIDTRLMAVYPVIIEKAFASTMDNYRMFIADYNKQVQLENKQIEKHNALVTEYCKNNILTEVQLEFRKIFLQKTKNYTSARAHNSAVQAFCDSYGLLIEQKKIQGVKYTTELVFQNLLHLYNSQLFKRNEKFIKAGLQSVRPIQEFKINSLLVTQLKRNEVNSLAICSKTVRNHTKRLQEAGVFVEYHFSGRNRAIEVHINPSILVVLDVFDSKIKTTDNKQVTFLKGKELPDNNDSTRTIKNEYKKKENVKNISLGFRSSSEALTPCNLFFTGTHASKSKNLHQGAGEKPVSKPVSISEKLQELIIHPQELAENLASGVYFNYKPIDIRILYNEAFSGTLTSDEFREIVIQDFFKSISKIYRFSTPFVGSWKKAINSYYVTKWLSFSGSSLNKNVLIDHITQMRWRTEWARKWFAKNQFSPLFPSDYFDPTRQNAKEVGFEYTKIKWKEHLANKDKYILIKQKQLGEANKRKARINDAKKCETALTRFFKDKMTYTELYNYVQNNLPIEFLEKLPDLILKKSLQIAQKEHTC